MARIVSGGSIAYDAMNHGMLNEMTLQQINQQNRDFSNNLSHDASDWFRQSAHNAFERYSGEVVRDRIQALMRKNDAFWKANTHRPLSTVGDFQHAPDVMKRYLAAHPGLGKKIVNQQAHGWGDPNLIEQGVGEDNHYYRILYHGCSQEVDGQEAWVLYFDEPEDGEHLTFRERLDNIRSHEAIDDLLGQGKDITDPLNKNW